MPTELVPRKFDAACLPLNLDCGPDQFGTIATKWITCADDTDCALQAIATRNTDVYLYSTPEGQLVGFGSLSKTTRKIKHVIEEWSFIPHVGIAGHLRGYPQGVPWNERYGASIMLDLMSLARDHQTPTLMLYVHRDNLPARRLYDKLGFLPLGGLNPRSYQPMTIENHD